jgi:heme-degrading monooxygenase HmoA
MFARVITAQAGAEGFDEVVRLAQHEISGAQQRPGFAGFYLLTDDETGKLINISLWETREEMEAVARGTAAGIHDEAVPETGVTSLRLETYEVAMQVLAIAIAIGASPGVPRDQPVPAHRRVEPVTRALTEGRVPQDWFGDVCR